MPAAGMQTAEIVAGPSPNGDWYYVRRPGGGKEFRIRGEDISHRVRGLSAWEFRVKLALYRAEQMREHPETRAADLKIKGIIYLIPLTSVRESSTMQTVQETRT